MEKNGGQLIWIQNNGRKVAYVDWSGRLFVLLASGEMAEADPELLATLRRIFKGGGD